MSNDKKTDGARAKAAMLEWMIDVLTSDERTSEEKTDAFRRWLADGSDPDVKIEGLRRAVDARASMAFDPSQVAARSEEARERWRDLAARLGLNPELDNYRAVRDKRIREGRVRRNGTIGQFPHRAATSLWRKYAMRAAAVLLPVAAVVGGYIWVQGLLAKENYVATDRLAPITDSIRHITLADGTRVTLNKDSELSWNEARECSLVGEAYFEVAKDAAGKPFTVHSGYVEVTVLGTKFNFKARDESSTLSLYEGSVKLDHAAGTHRLEEGGKQFRFDHATANVEMTDFDAAAEPEWIVWGDLYRFHALRDIFNMIESRYGVTFENRDSMDTTQRLSFRLMEGTSLPAVMEALRGASGDFEYTINDETIVLQPK